MKIIEIIDIKDREELGDTWKNFIFSHHYETHKSILIQFFAKHLVNQ